MRTTKLLKALLIPGMFAAGFLAAQGPPDNPLAQYVPNNMKLYYLDMLLLKDKPDTALPEAERAQEIQKHLAYIRSQVEAGNFALVGPIREETRLRGIAVIKADSLEAAQRIASADPLVQSGHLVVEVHPILLEDLSSIRFDYPAVR